MQRFLAHCFVVMVVIALRCDSAHFQFQIKHKSRQPRISIRILCAQVCRTERDDDKFSPHFPHDISTFHSSLRLNKF